MRPVYKPGPRSRTRQEKPRRTSSRKGADLGDTDVSTAESSFQSPVREPNQTDYGLEFTSSRPQLSPRRSRLAQEQLQSPSLRSRRTAGAGASTSVAVTASAPAVANRSRRKRRKPQHLLFLREYRKLVARTDLMIPRLSFGRLVREVIYQFSVDVTHITSDALQALQESSEMYLTQRLQDSYMLTLHRGRVTLSVQDMQLLNFLRTNGSN